MNRVFSWIYTNSLWFLSLNVYSEELGVVNWISVTLQCDTNCQSYSLIFTCQSVCRRSCSDILVSVILCAVHVSVSLCDTSVTFILWYSCVSHTLILLCCHTLVLFACQSFMCHSSYVTCHISFVYIFCYILLIYFSGRLTCYQI